MIVKTSPDEIQNYLVDASNYQGNCEAVYIPDSTQEISELLEGANKEKTNVTISGNGTGLTGARVPEGGIVISTEKLNNILEINKDKKYAIVQPGVLLSEFQKNIKKYDLLYPPDPTEKNCFIGGTVSTNASGEKTFKYGPTRNYVLELEVILPNGEFLDLQRGNQKANGNKLTLTTRNGNSFNLDIPNLTKTEIKNASGYYCHENMDAIDLFVGSEGTLGVITKIKLKLVPLPEKIISCVVFFEDEQFGLNYIRNARELSYQNRKNKAAELDALALEFFDQQALNFLKEFYKQIPNTAKAAVWFEQEVTSENEESIFEKWIELINKHNGSEENAWFAFNENDKKKMEEFRHAISEKVNDYISKNNFRKLGTDVAVPDDKFEILYNYSKDLVIKSDMDFVTYGHFGNSHMHLNMLPKNDSEFNLGKNIYNNICAKAVELNGTVSAEHGIGKIKTGYLLMMYGKENIKKMIDIKKALDPNWILGRGNLFSEDLLKELNIISL